MKVGRVRERRDRVIISNILKTSLPSKYYISLVFFFTDRYEIDLPSVLPPSHRGRVIRFTYKLIIGVHRTGGSMQSQIFQIPFRIFNRIDGKYGECE